MILGRWGDQLGAFVDLFTWPGSAPQWRRRTGTPRGRRELQETASLCTSRARRSTDRFSPQSTSWNSSSTHRIRSWKVLITATTSFHEVWILNGTLTWWGPAVGTCTKPPTKPSTRTAGAGGSLRRVFGWSFCCGTCPVKVREQRWRKHIHEKL